MKIIYGDITKADEDIIVCASNGIGYMGGYLGKRIKCKGVSESIHYETNGFVEKEAKKKCKKVKYLPSLLCGSRAGNLYVTDSYSLKSKFIIHAVTMYLPGTFTKEKTIKELIPKIIEKTRELEATSIAIPLLGCGTGMLNKDTVLHIYEEFFSKVQDIEVSLYIL